MTHETNRRFLILPLIVIIGCLGSFPIAEHFLVPSKLQTTKTVTITYTDGQCTSNVLSQTFVVVTPTPTPSASSTPTVTSTPTKAKSPTPAATSTPTKAKSPTPAATSTPDINATPTPTPTPVPPTALPTSLAQVWTATKSTAQDYKDALACATAFVNTYETFNYQHIDSTTAALPFLSADAKKRFSEGYEKVSANPRTTAVWQQQIITNQSIQTAKVSTIALEGYDNQNNELFLNFDVQYQLTTSLKGVKGTQKASMTVRLKKVQPDTKTSGIGWQVSDWRDDGATQ